MAGVQAIERRPLLSRLFTAAEKIIDGAVSTTKKQLVPGLQERDQIRQEVATIVNYLEDPTTSQTPAVSRARTDFAAIAENVAAESGREIKFLLLAGSLVSSINIALTVGAIREPSLADSALPLVIILSIIAYGGKRLYLDSKLASYCQAVDHAVTIANDIFSSQNAETPQAADILHTRLEKLEDDLQIPLVSSPTKKGELEGSPFPA